MPIPFRDSNELDELGAAGYLKFETDSYGSGYQGALFLINARGEPVEFTYNKIGTPYSFLWRRDDIRRHALRKLTASLLSLCPKIPRLIICLAEEVGSDLFCQDIQVSIPICCVAPAIKSTPFTGGEARETLEVAEPMNLFWHPGKPSDDSIESRLLRELISRELLVEPFDRTSIGLREVYSIKGDTTKNHCLLPLEPQRVLA